MRGYVCFTKRVYSRVGICASFLSITKHYNTHARHVRACMCINSLCAYLDGPLRLGRQFGGPEERHGAQEDEGEAEDGEACCVGIGGSCAVCVENG